MQQWYLENKIYLEIKQNTSKTIYESKENHREIIKYLNWIKMKTWDIKICELKLKQCLGNILEH